MNKIHTAEFDFPVVEERLKSVDSNLDVPAKAIIRTDTGKILGVMGDDYALIPHKRVIEDIEASLGDEITDRTVSICKDGAVMFAKYRSAKMQPVEIKKGDIVQFELVVFNSYNGVLPVGFSFAALRLVCTNGMTVPESMARLTVRHIGQPKIESVREEFMKRMPLYMQAFKEWQKWTEIPLKENRVEGFLKSTVNDKLQLDLAERIKTTKANTVWDLYNIYTDYCSHRIKVREGNEQNKRMAQFNFEKNVISKFYNYSWN